MKESERKKKKLNEKIIIIFCAVTAVFVLGVGLSYFFSEKANENLSFTAESGKTDFINGDIISVKSFSGKLFVLTERTFYCISPSGKEVFSFVHNYPDPGISVSDGYGVVFNKNSEEFFIFNSSKIIYSGNTYDKKEIITCAVSENGTVVFSLKSDESASLVYAVSKKGEKKYLWSCLDEYAVCFDVAKNGKSVAVGAVGAKGGELYSKTYLLSFSEKNALCDFTKEKSAVIDIKLNGKKIITTFRNERIIYDSLSQNGAGKSYDFPCNVYLADFGGYNSALVLQYVSSSSESPILLLGKNNEEILKNTFSGFISSISQKSKKLWFSSGEKIYCLSENGIEEKTEVSFDLKGIVLCGKKLFAYSSNALYFPD